MKITLEKLLTSKAGFDLTTASPLQRGISRAADGRPIGDVLDDDQIRAHFGCDRSELGVERPTIVELVTGVRSGKSLFASCAGVHGSLTADLSALKSHEIARFSIVAPTVDNATATFRLLAGSVRAAPTLAKLLVDEPTTDSLFLRRADGRVVEIMVVAAHRGAVTMRSRWSAGFVLDEVALFGAESQGAAVNADELLRAGETRLVPGAQGWLVSSPFGPSGLLYDLWSAHYGKPGRILVVHAPTTAMNPTFPVAQVEAIRRRAPDVAAREYDAAWVDADTAFMDGTAIDASVRVDPIELPPATGYGHVAAWDAATRGNSWTFIIARVEDDDGSTDPFVRIAVAMQWTGSKVAPLKPDVVIAEIGRVLKRYDIDTVLCDRWGVDALRPIAKAAGFDLDERNLSTAASIEAYETVKTLFATRRLELPPVSALVQDLKSIRKIALANGVRVELPKTGDGRHADFAPPMALVVSNARDVAARARRRRAPRPRGSLRTRNFDNSAIGFCGPDDDAPGIPPRVTRARGSAARPTFAELASSEFPPDRIRR